MISIRFLAGRFDLPGRRTDPIYWAPTAGARAAAVASIAAVSGILRSRLGLLLASVALALGVWISLASGSEASTSCSELAAQADAQASFAELGGSARHAVGGLDEDGDGIACEGLSAPYAGYATLGYNHKGGFLYGVVSMPAAPSGKERYPCLRGNGKGPKGPRRLRVYRVTPSGDRAILGGVPAEARPESGHLRWKVERPPPTPGLYYVAFREALPLTPYGRSECPGFRSRTVRLPQPRGLSR